MSKVPLLFKDVNFYTRIKNLKYAVYLSQNIKTLSTIYRNSFDITNIVYMNYFGHKSLEVMGYLCFRHAVTLLISSLI